MAHVRKGDLVVVTKGKDKGKRGKILKVVGQRVIVEKVAMIKRHSKPSQKNPQGGIVDKEGTIHISNVQLFDDKLGRGTRTKMAFMRIRTDPVTAMCRRTSSRSRRDCAVEMTCICRRAEPDCSSARERICEATGSSCKMSA